jgi:hypothetical protein
MNMDTEINEILRLSGLNERAEENEFIRNTWDTSESNDDPRIFVRFSGLLDSSINTAEGIAQKIAQFLAHCESESTFLSQSQSKSITSESPGRTWAFPGHKGLNLQWNSEELVFPDVSQRNAYIMRTLNPRGYVRW